MIASVSGILTQKSPHSGGGAVVVDVNGVGYQVSVSLNSFSKLPAPGSKVFLFVHTAVREDDIALFGFTDDGEKRIFQKLIGVNGIGPKLALTILSGIAPQDLIDALHHEDATRLTAISGIGRKTAERMILDLKDKLKDFPAVSSKNSLFEEAASALVNLGYNRATAERTLAKIPLGEGSPVEGVIRQALKILSTENAA